MAELISGAAYGERATLEICGDALTWRARPTSDVKENIATTIHDVRGCTFVEQRASLLGMIALAAGIAACITGNYITGAIAIAAGIVLVVHRAARARRVLRLELADRRLAMDVDQPSASRARSLVARIERVIESGEAPSSPASLP